MKLNWVGEGFKLERNFFILLVRLIFYNIAESGTTIYTTFICYM